MDTVEDIGRRLVSLRRDRGMSQRRLGETLGVKQQQVARWEATAYRTATLARVAATAEALGLVLDEAPSAPLAAEAPAAYETAAPGLELDAASALRRLGVRAEHLAAFCRSHGIVRMELFGSVLADEFGPGSDVDVLVSYASGRTPGLLAAADQEMELSAIARRRVDLVTRTSVERSENRERRENVLASTRSVYAAG